jgi:FtsH-binding integral membrane protein
VPVRGRLKDDEGVGSMSVEPEARIMMMKARLYRMFAIGFAVVGLVIFCTMFANHIEGSFFATLSDPYLVVVILFPFLPAIALSMRANKIERNCLKKYPRPKAQDT